MTLLLFLPMKGPINDWKKCCKFRIFFLCQLFFFLFLLTFVNSSNGDDFNQRSLGPLFPTKISMSWSFLNELN